MEAALDHWAKDTSHSICCPQNHASENGLSSGLLPPRGTLHHHRERGRETATAAAAYPTPYLGTTFLSLVTGERLVPLVGREAAVSSPSSRYSLALHVAFPALGRQVSQIPKPPANSPLPTAKPPQTQGYFRPGIAIDDDVLGWRFGASYHWFADDVSH